MNNQALALDRLLPRASIDTFTLTERINYVKEHGGHSQHFSTLQPNMSYFDMPGIGYVAYMKYWGKQYVLADPVCARGNLDMVLTAFMNRFPHASFIQVSKDVADVLHDRFGMYGTQFGSEAKIDLQKWSLKGKKKQVIRTAINQANKQGIVVKERISDDHTREISDSWLKTRKCKSTEIRFLIRPMHMNYTEGTRNFYAYQDGKPVAFIFFDPTYYKNEIVGYVPNISRSSAEFKQGLYYTIITHAMQVFKEEGIHYMDLGLIPLLFQEDDHPHESMLLKRSLRFMYDKCNFLYNFKGLAFTKSRFRGDVSRTYCCHKKPMPLIELFSILRLTRIV